MGSAMTSVSTIMQWKAEGKAEGVAEGMALGMLECRRSDVLKVLRLRFPEAPYELTATVRGMKDLDQLGRWFEAAVVAPSLDMFRAMAADADTRVRR
jgi:hypothetical protein